MKTKAKIKTGVHLFFLSIVLTISSFAQSPNWQWAKSAGGIKSENANSVIVDALGNVYITGSFSSPTITFGSTVLNNIDNTGNTGDMFLVKYNAAGNVLWVKHFGGTSNDVASSLALDGNGNIYVTGSSTSLATWFGGLTINSNWPDYYPFIAKWDPTGNIIWAKKGSTLSDDAFSFSIGVDGSGNSYITGVRINGSNYTYFTAKHDALGNYLWQNYAGGNNFISGNCIAVDVLGNSYVMGTFASPFGFTLDNITLTNGGYSGTKEVFVVSYNALGSVRWLKKIGGINDEEGKGIKVDENGNIYVTGTFNGSTVSIGSTTLAKVGNTDIFIAKYDTLGNVLWAKSAGGSSLDNASSIAVDADGSSYVTGYFSSPDLSFGNTTLTSSGSSDVDVFIAKYDSLGNALWAQSIGGASFDYSTSIAADTGGSCYITGGFQSSTMSVGSNTLTNAVNTTTTDVFIAKLKNPIAPVSAFTPSTTNICQSGCINFTDNSTDSPTSWNWSFPGATVASSTAQHPANICYNTPGTYIVKLVVANASGADSISHTITINANPTTAAAGTDQTVCATTATLAANTPVTGTGLWTLVSGSGTITSPTAPTSGVTALGTGTNVFRWTISNGSCTASADEVSIVVSASPTTANAGIDQMVCATTATLAGNMATSGTGTWTLVSGSGIIAAPTSPTSGVTALGTGTNIFRWTISNGSCTVSADDVNIAVGASPTTANAGTDQTICATAATLAGNIATSGTGTWTLVSGSGIIAAPTAPTSGVTALGTGTNVFRWTISNGSCTASADDVNITVSASPTTANAGTDQTICATAATLAGNMATSGTGTWTLVSGSGTITSPASPASGVTSLGVGTNVFQWTITTGSCSSSNDQVSIIVSNPLVIPTISISGNVLTCSPSYTNYQWYKNNASINGATSQSYTITQNANYKVTVSDNGCSATSAIFSVVPDNDECVNAIPLTSGISVNYTSGTTENGSESEPAISCSNSTGNANDDVWYKFTALSLLHTVQVQGAWNFNAVVDVRSGSCSGASVACADDAFSGSLETVNLSGLTIGNIYYIRVYDYYSTGGGDFQIAVTHPFSTSVASINNEEFEVALYPNPTRDIVTIEWPQTTTDKFSFVLYNSIGKLVQELNIVNNINHTASISLEDTPAGVYFFSLISNDGKVKKGKIVKE